MTTTTPTTAQTTSTTPSALEARSRALPATVRRLRTRALARLRAATTGDAGMSTVEYAIGTLAAAAFGAVLYTVVSGDSIPRALGQIIERALTASV